MGKKSVIIIGGGIAGLSAAKALAERGVVVTILEVKNTLGGRIKEVMTSNGVAELGAEFIHGRSPALLEAIHAANLTARQMPAGHQLIMNGKRQAIDFFANVNAVLGEIEPLNPDLSFAEYLKTKQFPKLHGKLAWDYVNGFEAADAHKISCHSLYIAGKAADPMDGEWQGRILEGYGALVNDFAAKIIRAGGRLLTSARVQKIHWKPGAVNVVFQHHQRKKVSKGAAAVIALPLGVWKKSTVKFVPKLKEKTEAAARMELGNVVRVVLGFKQKWWPKSFTGFVQAPDCDLPTWWPGIRGPMLTGWAGGEKADRLAGLGTDELRARSLHSLAKIFAMNQNALEKKLVEFHTHDWTRDEHIGGAYSYIPVGGLDLPKILAQPVQETLYFAGEATVSDCQTGTVFGAMESGLRAAEEFLKSQTDARLIRKFAGKSKLHRN